MAAHNAAETNVPTTTVAPSLNDTVVSPEVPGR